MLLMRPSTHWVVSIHTPTKGVTSSFLTFMMFTNVSIHTPTKGVTQFDLQKF